MQLRRDAVLRVTLMSALSSVSPTRLPMLVPSALASSSTVSFFCRRSALIAAADVYPALEKGTLDAVEFVGPYDDEKLGLAKVARYFYGPGVMELGASLCFIANKKAWAELPDSYKAALKAACAQANAEMLAKYDVGNVPALKRLVGGGARLSYWSKPIMDALHQSTREVLKEESASNPLFAKVHAQWQAFIDEQLVWSSVNDGAAEQYMLGTRRAAAARR